MYGWQDSTAIWSYDQDLTCQLFIYQYFTFQLFTASASHINTPQRLQPPDSGFSEPVNNNAVGEDNNNGPISYREMQNIANNNAGEYIYNENEDHHVWVPGPAVWLDAVPEELMNEDDPLEPYTEWFSK